MDDRRVIAPIQHDVAGLDGRWSERRHPDEFPVANRRVHAPAERAEAHLMPFAQQALDDLGEARRVTFGGISHPWARTKSTTVASGTKGNAKHGTRSTISARR